MAKLIIILINFLIDIYINIYMGLKYYVLFKNIITKNC